DGYGHGTHVAGTAAALDNGVGVVGVAPGARLWAVKVLGNNGTGRLSDIIEGIDWVTANAATIEVANMSLGGQGVSTTYREAIQASVHAGVVYVVAAGNEYRDILGADFQFGTSDDTIPAAYPEVATISAIADTDGIPGGYGPLTDYADYFGSYEDDTFADFSNFSNSDGNGESWYLDLDTNGDPNNPVSSAGLGIDLMMPGVDIDSTYKDGGYAVGSGTSMASPHAAGLAALHIATNGRATDAAGVYAIRQALIDAGKPWRSEEGLGLITGSNPDSPDKHEENLGWAGPSGPVDQLPTVTVTSPTDGGTVSGTVTVEADASDDVAVTQVEFFVNGSSIGIDSDDTDGWSATWDTISSGDGSHTVTATATDTASQSASDSVTVTVDNVDDAPTVAITNPADASTVSGTVNVSADASDDHGVSQVEFFVGELSIGVDSDSSDGWSATWDTTSSGDGSHTITATATDTASQTASDSVGVTVNNTVATMHVGDLDATSTSQGRRWTAMVTITVHDAAENLVVDAEVGGSWSGGVSGDASCITDATGTCTVERSGIHKKAGVVTFTVDSVTGSLSYDPGDNHDEDGGSDGTSINVNKPLHIAKPSVNDDLVGAPLTQSMVRPVVDAAISHWAAAGVASDSLDALREVDVEIFDLRGSLLGLAYSDWIVLDRDAAGYGWLADPLVAGSLHSGAVDLFSAVTHEFGHLLGFEHNDRQRDVMAPNLNLDTRQLYSGTQLTLIDRLVFAPLTSSRPGDLDDHDEPSVLADIKLAELPSAMSIAAQPQRPVRADDARLFDDAIDDATSIDDELLDLLVQEL
nr:S8 family serine peptidase [Planctomycetota bacterium]